MQGLLLAWGLAGCGALGCGVIGLEPRLGADAGEVDRCTEASAVDWASTPMPTDRRDGLPKPTSSKTHDSDESATDGDSSDGGRPSTSKPERTSPRQGKGH